MTSGMATAHDPAGPHTIANLPLERVSERVYVVHASQRLPNKENAGFANNPGFVVTAHGVIVVDPGSSVQIGKELLKKIGTVTDQPVIAVLNTHVHGDHSLGNHAMRLAYPKVPIYAHVRAIERMQSGEGEDWINLFMDMTGGAVAGTEVVAPNIGLSGNEILNLDGVALRFHHTGKAHTDHDLMIEVMADKTIFLGDVVAAEHVPSSDVPRDAHFKGQIHAIRTILKRPIDVYIPGHGRTGGREVPQASLDFLERLYRQVAKGYWQGRADYEMREDIVQDLAAYRDWYNFDDLGRVISHVYLEIEAESF